MRGSILVAAVLIAVFPATAFADCQVTKAQYDALQTGMSYRQAVSILGCEGEELSSSEIAGFKTVMYAWYGSRWTGANMNAMFQNGGLVQKAQFGLK